jgi:4-amino-4-deoxy-L-arabinose transferase-like glycosyltransferase
MVVIAATTLSIYKSSWVSGSSCFSHDTLHIPVTGAEFTYHRNCDSPAFIKAGQNFPGHFKEDKIRMSRPGYPALENLLSKFGAFFHGLRGAIILNVLLAWSASVLFYMLVKEFFDKKIAIISTLLLLLSTHFHLFLGQAHTEVAGDAIVVFTLFLLFRYIKRPSPMRLIVFSLIIGLLMLIKLVFALPIFFLLLALKYRRIKEFFVHIVLIVLPSIGWYLYVTRVLKTAFKSAEVSVYQQGTWYFHFLPHPSRWDDLVRAMVYSNGLFLIDVMVAFLVILPPLSIYGLLKWPHYKNDKYFWYLSFTVSFALMLFLILWGGARLAFGIFPIILPFGVYGLFTLLDPHKIQSKSMRYGVLGILAVLAVSVTFINVYEIAPSYDNNHVRDISQVSIPKGQL